MTNQGGPENRDCPGLRPAPGRPGTVPGFPWLLAFVLIACCQQGGVKVGVLIPAGLSTRAIAETLRQHQVIDNPEKFRVLARVFGFDKKLRQGRYEFSPNTEELFVLFTMTQPGHGSVRVTIPEGFTMNQVANMLEEHGVCPASGFLETCKDRALLDTLKIPLRSAEGYLFPDTYELEVGSDPAEVITRMVRHFFSVYDELENGTQNPEEPQRHREGVGSVQSAIQNPKSKTQEVVILASIVECEAVKPDEAALIAGVFLNRLGKHMPLQSCATVEYILPVHKKERLTVEDTRIESPYNTYLHAGLPPGPICNPGRTGLSAALNPSATDYLYFLSKGDGGHVFSRTWHEHETARRRLQRDHD